ncbi:transforming growth factor-beta-induced protein ig-h3-like [Lytechinus variegatus]|uniref:transforming growth factor-beta-induced protein ig-h3-like n=1 Tax=Lytechinus variegatus TaxID=7654 RepID=UPI001BB296F0|nr:transforming growth factor-beta-induced protein ig-h3-like [Lytechinus variegatus]
MQSVVAFLAVLVGVAVAVNPTPKPASSDDIKQKNREISSTEYLRKMLEKPSSKLFFSPIDVSTHDDVLDLLEILGLGEASKIVEQVNMRQMLRDEQLASVTLCLPNDEAVLKWRSELSDKLKPDQASLKQLVRAWVIPGTIRSTDVVNNQKVQSLNGAKLRFNVNQVTKMVTVNGAKIVKADNIASNGFVQVVDKVIYPLPVGNVIDTLDDNEAFSTIFALLKRADLVDLAVSDPVTVLVPTNAAFDALPSGALSNLLRNVTKLRNILKNHVISDVRYSASLSSGQRLRTSQGSEISVTIENGKIILNKERDPSKASQVIKADIPTTNGVIHVIDRVIVPSQEHYVL